ncbi:MAG: TetR/AcrR family transcriptional regulator [Polyangiaceae bacterium]
MARVSKSRPRKLPTQARAQETVEAILAATKRVLVRDGYEKTTTNRVAEVAGVSIGSLYQYFPSKEALVTALIERHLATMLEVLASTYTASNQTMTIAETARSVIRAAFAAHRVNPKLHRVLLEQMARNGTIDQIAGFEEQAQRLVESFLENHAHEVRPKNIKLAARVALLAVRGTTLWTVLRMPEQLDDTAFIDEISDMIVRYLVP